MSGIIEQPRASCALAAQQTVLAIPKALPIIHAGPGCAAKAFHFAAYGSGYQGEGYAGGSAISCTNASDQDVIFGGENKLNNLVEGALRVLKGDLFVILAGCTSGIVGDDVEQVASSFASNGHPVVGVDTSGFRGNNYFGHELVVKEIIEQFVGDVEPKVQSGLVNVFSVVPFQNPYWRADLEEIKRLLEAIGLQVNILFGNESSGIDEWQNIPHAQFNLVLSTWVGLSVAKQLEEKYGTPFLHFPYLPVGAEASSKFLRSVAAFAGLPKNRESSGNLVEKIIQKEEKKFYSYFVSLADFIGDLRNQIPFNLYAVADSTYALGVSDFLINEMGFIPQKIYITDEADAKYSKLVEKTWLDIAPEFGSALTLEADGGKIQQDMRLHIGKSAQAAIFGSTWEANLAAENNNLLLHLSLPINDDVIINRSFAGYTGGLRLIEEFYAGIFRKGNIIRSTLAQ